MLRALAAAEKSGEMDNIYAAYAKGLIGDALFKEEHYKEAALAYKDGLQAYEMHYDGETSPIAIEIVGERLSCTVRHKGFLNFVKGASKCLATALIDKEDYALATAVCEEVLERSASLFGESSAEYASEC